MRRSPLTPIFNYEPRRGSIVVGNSPGSPLPPPGPPTNSLSIIGSISSADLAYPFDVVAIDSTYAVVSVEDGNKLAIMDLSDVTIPAIDSFFTHAQILAPRGMKANSGLLFVTNFTGDRIVKLDSSAIPTLSYLAASGTSLTEQVSWCDTTDDGYVVGWCNAGDYRLTTHLISTMADQDHVQSISSNRGLQVVNNDVAVFGNGANIRCGNIINKTNISMYTPLALGSNVLGVTADNSINRAYARRSNSLDIVDITNPNAMSIVSTTGALTTMDASVGGHPLIKYGNTLAWTTNDGMELCDISNELAPTVTATLTGLPEGVSLTLFDNYILLTANNTTPGDLYVVGP
ncbi:MAG: hypothetical protein LC687_05135 [Actinobacteria bacterium]|nr:hypothetical protein [Actinomycetota bacterium]